ncbi:phytanoyl-CoA dioxygenase family protein [Novosphingobium pentaromativorans]|uniref:Phytanoyl-CoA dioxygenase n=1 Tax=Novosphingobium pentaromativorans US6-1 TaxID=1088721 RepID=G6EKL4_9SPHN|nr:phytanoyl-CoA dioxygenase family protein [Novosphingobium pentaromativorans]AIT82806.1 phytanoyl-CoA dioxygenase [Novosphingobium pentaromativorans US6-1]EHJ58170.1 phytanoyl-CoA dioxygenase [Novosphingobium pentaromativorans US6-1]
MTVRAKAKTILLSPVWALQLLTSAKSFLDNPLIGSNRLNRWGLHRSRVRLADALCRWRRRRLAGKLRPDWREAFERDGFVVVHDVVPPAEFPALRAALLAYEGPAREMRQGDAITRRMAIDPQMLSAIPALRALLARKDLLALFHYVAGFRTTPLHYIQTIVSHCGGNEPDPQESVHADSFHASMKAWLFLNPVSVEEGPFTYVRGSHRFDEARLAWEKRRSLRDPKAIDRLSARGSPRVTPQDLEDMGLGQAEPLALPANTLVVADTGGFHARGKAESSGERVEIWSYARRNPFLPWLGGDLLSLPGIAERRIGWLWSFRDRFEARIGQPWKPAGHRRPTDAET